MASTKNILPNSFCPCNITKAHESPSEECAYESYFAPTRKLLCANKSYFAPTKSYFAPTRATLRQRELLIHRCSNCRPGNCIICAKEGGTIGRGSDRGSPITLPFADDRFLKLYKPTSNLFAPLNWFGQGSKGIWEPHTHQWYSNNASMHRSVLFTVHGELR